MQPEALLERNMIMKTAIFGSAGYLGGHFLQAYPDALTPKLDIADRTAVAAFLDEHKPGVVINAAGKTGVPNVDWCEDHKEETTHSNVTGPIVLMEECVKRGVLLVHLSSGCIYAGDNGGRGYAETDEPNFDGSFYSRTKAEAEKALREFPVLILRLRMPFDDSTNPKNLLMKVRKFANVNDVQNSLTYLPDFVAAAKTLIEKKKTGIYNVTNPGAMSPYEIVELYKEIVDPTHSAERVPAEKLGALSKVGRSNCILNTAKLEAEGIRLRSTEEAVRTAWKAVKNG